MELWKDSCCSRRKADQRSLAIRADDTGHVSVKTLFVSENFNS